MPSEKPIKVEGVGGWGWLGGGVGAGDRDGGTGVKRCNGKGGKWRLVRMIRVCVGSQNLIVKYFTFINLYYIFIFILNQLCYMNNSFMPLDEPFFHR